MESVTYQRFVSLIFVLFVFLVSFSLSSINAAAWLTRWGYRKSHTIDGSAAGDQTNYQIRVTIYNTTGTDGGEEVYVEDKARSDFGDIRFTNSTDDEIDYWIEDFGNNYARIWVEIPHIPIDPGTETIYIYYGRSDVTTTSDFSYVTETELTNPGFENTGTCLEPNAKSNPNFAWVHFDATGDDDCWEVNSNRARSGAQSFGNNYGCSQVCSDDEGGAGTYPTTYMYQNVPVDDSYQYIINVTYWWQGEPFDGSGCPDLTEAGGEDDSRLRAIFYDSGSVEIGSYLGPSFSGLGYTQNWVWQQYNNTELITPSGTARIKVQVEGGDNNNQCGSFTAGANAGGYYDGFFLFVRKYTSPPPTHGDWGDEEITITPIIKQFSYDGDSEQLNVYWVAEYKGPSSNLINVTCILNQGTVNEHVCDPPPDLGGGGGCYFSPPDYLMNQDGIELRTIVNTLYCKACNQDNPTLCDEVTETFYPLNFEVALPGAISPVVGDKQSLGITITNKGMLTDNYSVSVVSSDPGSLLVEDGDQVAQLIETDNLGRLYVDMTLLTSVASPRADVTVTSEMSQGFEQITFSQSVNVKGTDKSLPDFGIIGILQIMIIAALLVSFLY